MDMIVSQLPALGIFAGRLAELPPELGLELHFETGNDYFWRHYVPMLMKDRTGPLSVHGPFSGINLADPDSDWPGALEEYKQCFAFCAEYGAVHCVCHPDAPLRKRPPERAAGDLSLAVERLMELQSEAQRFGVCMLVENLPSANSLFGWDVFLSEIYGHEELSFLLDAGHAILSGWDMPDYMRRMGGRLNAIHIHEPFNGLFRGV